MELVQWACLGMLILVAAAVALQCLHTRSGVLHLPFLGAVAFLGLLGIQAIGVIRTQSAPWYAVTKFLLFSCLCLAALHLGWQRTSSRPLRVSRGSPFELRFFLYVGLVLEAIGLVGLARLGDLVGGLDKLYLEAAGYKLEWRGLPVIYTFFASLLTPGTVLVALVALRRRSSKQLLLAFPGFLYHLLSVVLVARRTPMIILGLTLLCIFWFTRGYVPSRLVLAGAGLLMVVAVFALPAYRRAGGILSQTPPVGQGDSIGQALATGGAEFRDGCYLVQVTEEEGAFHYGLGFYNSLVRYFVPRRLVGDEMKERLLIDLPDAGHVGPQAGQVPNRYGWKIEPTIVPTGPASVFQQFWYFGFLVYFFLARWFRHHWDRATAGDLWSQIVYTTALTYGIASFVNDVYAIYPAWFQFLFPLWLARKLALLVAPWPTHPNPVVLVGNSYMQVRRVGAP